jgi:SAM-dependent methyltransferase
MQAELARVTELGWDIPPLQEDGVRYFAADRSTALSYPDEGLGILEGAESGSGYWFHHRTQSVAALLSRFGVTSMWEIGAGNGAMADQLTASLEHVVTVEPLAAGAQSAADMGLPALCGTLQDLHLPENSVEAIGAFDVVEHIEEPKEFLDEVHRVLRPGGKLIVTVPAFTLLWGDEDDVAGHFRRYTRSSLSMEFAASGFRTLHVEFLFASLVAPAFLVRALPYKLGRRRSKEVVLSNIGAQLQVRPVFDRVARGVLATEDWIADRVRLPVGLSLVGVFARN